MVERQRVQLDVVGAASAPSTTQVTYCHISDRLVSIAPLGRDSVPEVYISRTGSSSLDRTYGARRAVVLEPVRDVGPAVRDVAAAEPDAARVTVPADAASALSATGDQRVLDHEAVAPQWSRMNAISSAPSMKLTGTSTTPGPGGGEVQHRELPAVVAQQRQPVALRRGRRRPAPPPYGRRGRRTRRTSAGCPPSTIASLSGRRAAVRRGRSPRLCWRACWTRSPRDGSAMPHRNAAGNAPAAPAVGLCNDHHQRGRRRRGRHDRTAPTTRAGCRCCSGLLFGLAGMGSSSAAMVLPIMGPDLGVSHQRRRLGDQPLRADARGHHRGLRPDLRPGRGPAPAAGRAAADDGRRAAGGRRPHLRGAAARRGCSRAPAPPPCPRSAWRSCPRGTTARCAGSRSAGWPAPPPR